MNATLQEATATTVTSALNVRSVGKKLLMAVTGFVAIGYVVGHMLGNLQIFIGQDQLNTYAEALHSMGPLLWVVRAFLILAFGVHIWKGLQLKLENMASRPIAYHRKEYVEASLASRTMVLSGLTVLAFVIYHILHFTRGLQVLLQGHFSKEKLKAFPWKSWWIILIYTI